MIVFGLWSVRYALACRNDPRRTHIATERPLAEIYDKLKHIGQTKTNISPQ